MNTCEFCGGPLDPVELPEGSPRKRFCSKKCRTRQNSLNYLNKKKNANQPQQP